MKIAVVGVGAMGSIYAGLLADAGHEVWAIDIWQEHIDAIKEKGLRITGCQRSRYCMQARMKSLSDQVLLDTAAAQYFR